MKSGQVLVMLLVFMAMAITVTTAAVGLSISNSWSNNRLQTSHEALVIAESGAEDALLRLLRNPALSETYDLSDGDAQATITVSGTSPVTITSVGTVGNFQRTVVVTGNFVGVIFNISSWTQTF